VGAAVLVWASAKVVDFLDLPGTALGVGVGLVVVLAWVALLTVRRRGAEGGLGSPAGVCTGTAGRC
jgi:hypothetical protein